ncbi:hypothetical protein UNSWCD_218 [Campylobacter concisus UNSWCD]|nr:hypothetical protein UNSWCD_218 [Campylobacter concisus UNSWCD]
MRQIYGKAVSFMRLNFNSLPRPILLFVFFNIAINKKVANKSV